MGKQQHLHISIRTQILCTKKTPCKSYRNNEGMSIMYIFFHLSFLWRRFDHSYPLISLCIFIYMNKIFNQCTLSCACPYSGILFVVAVCHIFWLFMFLSQLLQILGNLELDLYHKDTCLSLKTILPPNFSGYFCCWFTVS